MLVNGKHLLWIDGWHNHNEINEGENYMIKISKTILVYTSWEVSLHLKKDFIFKIIFQNLFQNLKDS